MGDGVGGDDNIGSGLFDGFEQYRTFTSEDYKQVLSEGLIVPDANVLLNLYRYSPEARTDLLKILQRLPGELWVPHQVVVEFWHNRESAIADPQNSADATLEALNGQLGDAVNTLRSWGRRAAIAEDRLEEMSTALDKAFSSVTSAVNDSVDPEELAERRDTSTDEVLSSLEGILEGKVGPPIAPEQRDAVIAEAHRRIEASEPPGYLDAKKGEALAAGDYLIWEQILRKVQAEPRDVLLITGDVKEDWWRREKGETKGPRLELAAELRARAGVALFMVRPETLFLLAREHLAIEVTESSVEDAERVASLFSGGGGWTAYALLRALERLDREAPVQAAVTRGAIEQGGFIERDAVYDLGEYREERTLRGFTRRANRVTQELRDDGTLPASAKDLLEAVYDPKISYVQASGFRIPGELTALRSHDPNVEIPYGWILERATRARTAGTATTSLTFRDLDGSLRTIHVPNHLTDGMDVG